jgi:myo-inositol-1(or 4)-monophosphatase
MLIGMERELRAARKAALEAGKILMKYYGKIGAEKKADGTLVTRADRESEKRIKWILSKQFPDYSFLGEETGRDDRKSEYTWIVDPLDGTTNYSIRNPFFNVSIALVKRNEPVLGVVYCPFQHEMFTAVKGRGAYLNGRKIQVSRQSDIRKSSLAFCHAWGNQETTDRVTSIFHGFKSVISTFRQMGATALELAYVAAGRIDGFIHVELKPWDVAAGVVIVREAGGKVTDFSGAEYNMDSRELAATNGRVHASVLRTIKRSLNA